MEGSDDVYPAIGARSTRWWGSDDVHPAVGAMSTRRMNYSLDSDPLCWWEKRQEQIKKEKEVLIKEIRVFSFRELAFLRHISKERIKKEMEEKAITEQIIKQIEMKQAKQERLKNKAKDRQGQANDKQRLEEKAKEEEAEALKEKVLRQYRLNLWDESTSYRQYFETVKKVPVIGWQAQQGESSKEARRNKISEDTGTEIPGMPNDLALAANSSFASLHTSSDVPNCNLIEAKDKTTALHFNQKQSSIGPEVRIDVLDADNGQVSTTMLDGPSQENRFLHNGTSTLIPGGPSQQIRLANDNNNTILEDRIVMLGGPSREMSELERTSDEPEERINMLDDDDGSASSTDDDDDGNGNGNDEDDDDGNGEDDDDGDGNGNGNGNGNDDDDNGNGNDEDDDDDNGNDEVQPQGNYFPDGTNDAMLAAGCQFIATIVTAKSPVSSTTALCGYIAVTGFGCNLIAALCRRRRPDIARVLFRIGVSASAFTVLIGLGQYLPLQWHLNIAIPAVACLIIAVVVALSNLD